MKNLLTSICIAFSLVVSIPLVLSAESWVLWEKGDIIKKSLQQSIYWNIIDAYPQYEQCGKGKAGMFQYFKQRAEEEKQTLGVTEVKTVAPELVIKSFKGEHEILSWSHALFCLPGTLDPRERK